MCRAATCIRARFTAQVDAEESRHVLAGEPVPLPGLDADVQRRGLPHARRRLGRRWDRPRCRRRPAIGYFEFPYYLTQGTWTATATNRLLLEAGCSAGFAYWHGGAGTGAAGRRLRPDPGRRAGGHRRPPRQLRVPRHQHRRRQLSEHQELARVGVVRDRRAQLEGRLPGGYQRADTGLDHRRVRGSPTASTTGCRTSSRSGCRTSGRPIGR